MAIEFRPSSAPKRKELPVEDRSGPQCPSPSLPDTSAGNPDGQHRSTAERKDSPVIIGQAHAAKEDRERTSPEPGTKGGETLSPADIGLAIQSKQRGTKSKSQIVGAGTQALPVDTHSRAQFDRLKYQREYMRDRNTIKRLGLNMTVGEWRKSKGLPS